MQLWRSCAALALLAIASGRADGQEIRLGLHGGQVSDEAGAVDAGVTIAPELLWFGTNAAARLGLSGTAMRGGALIGGASAEGEATLWRVGPFSLLAGGTASAVASEAGYRAAAIGLMPGVRIGGDVYSADVRAVLRAGGEEHTAQRPSPGLLPLPDRAANGGMAWRQATGAAASLTAAPGPLAVTLGATRMRVDENVSWTDWTGAATLDLGPMRAGVNVGRRTGAAAGTWGSASLQAPLTSHVGAAVALGSHPSEPLTGRSSGRFATLGLQLSLPHRGASAVGIRLPRGVPSGLTALELRAEPGARVELVADWADWEPRPVNEATPGVYSVAVALKPGTYRFAFRVDGRWTVPSGYETESDEYGGRRAVLRVVG